ncbi:hypothetical protein [Chlamydia vaughanii]|uniref:hypothetical protein n=1 Tax=Chlamydia vaughanii TaxID=3112552 RepID=UPI0032B1D01E
MSLPGLASDSPTHKNTLISIEPSKGQQVAKKKGHNIFAIISMLVLCILALVMTGALLATPFFPEAVYLGLGALGAILIVLIILPIAMSFLSRPTAIADVRPKDLDMSKLDTRYNRLLHDVIKEDEDKFKQEQEVKAKKVKFRRAPRPRPQPIESSSSSSDSSAPQRIRRSSVLNLIRPKQPKPEESEDSDSMSSDPLPMRSPVIARPWTSSIPAKKNNKT